MPLGIDDTSNLLAYEPATRGKDSVSHDRVKDQESQESADVLSPSATATPGSVAANQ